MDQEDPRESRAAVEALTVALRTGLRPLPEMEADLAAALASRDPLTRSRAARALPLLADIYRRQEDGKTLASRFMGRGAVLFAMALHDPQDFEPVARIASRDARDGFARTCLACPDYRYSPRRRGA